ncbi:hypothetical protein F4553_001674 [Allocatelliglobosispora scoriae]|uniref:Uncharacterized protein n=1 Tax=Allocatelliglobosispora scoriae TaxID=643052 RepID=A0A841BKX9_9ACTN|nr:hypothetical protein [Allocatelliglobosispora scoriae]MBB5868295.1 hypothetical protein [Allocatelliglobosispora scoriae]
MTSWEVWRQDDNGVRYRMSTHSDRIDAITRVIVMESGPVHKQMYWVDGPNRPACKTLRDAYKRVALAGQAASAAGRTLTEFLGSWWLVSRPLADLPELDLDTMTAMLTAAMTATPRQIPEVRTASPGAAASHAEWTQLILAQIADLRELSMTGDLGRYGHFGVDAPSGLRRGTGVRWFNLDVESYVECGLAGFLDYHPDKAFSTVDWGHLTHIARCGQSYE